jgi:hypothetical protein
MKIRFTKFDQNEVVVVDKKQVNVGDIVDVPKAAATHWVGEGKAEKVATKKVQEGGNE